MYHWWYNWLHKTSKLILNFIFI